MSNTWPSFQNWPSLNAHGAERYFKCSLCERKVHLKYQITDLFPRVKNSASFCRKRSWPGPEGPPPLLPDPHHSSPGAMLLALYSYACSQTSGSHSTEPHSHLVSSVVVFLTQMVFVSQRMWLFKQGKHCWSLAKLNPWKTKKWENCEISTIHKMLTKFLSRLCILRLSVTYSRVFVWTRDPTVFHTVDLPSGNKEILRKWSL